MTRAFRRIIVDSNDDGRSSIVHDAEIQMSRLVSGNALVNVWGSDVAPRLTPIRSLEFASELPPPPNGSRVLLFALPGLDNRSAPEDGIVLAGLGGSDAPGVRRGMHETPTLDVAIILSGTIRLEVEMEPATDLSPFETVVLNGARHCWTNVSTEDALLAILMVGGLKERQ